MGCVMTCTYAELLAIRASLLNRVRGVDGGWVLTVEGESRQTETSPGTVFRGSGFSRTRSRATEGEGAGSDKRTRGEADQPVGDRAVGNRYCRSRRGGHIATRPNTAEKVVMDGPLAPSCSLLDGPAGHHLLPGVQVRADGRARRRFSGLSALPGHHEQPMGGL